jgi:hypothetical protein
MPTCVVALSTARMISNHLNTATVGSNPAQGTDAYLRFSVLCFPV